MKLTTAITEYITFRKALGARLSVIEKVLRRFSRVMGEEVAVHEVEAEQVNAFLMGKGPLTSSWHVRHNALAGFYRYAVKHGFVAVMPLPAIVPKRPRTFVPYIYSREELRRLLDAIPACRRTCRKLEAPTVRAMLLLLYGAGLRLGEALSLTLADVDLAESLLTLRETKFFKTRLIALGKDLRLAVQQYANWRQQAGHSLGGHAPFFVYRTGAPVNADTLEGVFQQLRVLAGVHRSDGARYQPRLHDLRHTFAVHRLTAWYAEGADVQKLLPLLSTYLGHVRLAETQVYLTMTPELLREAGARFQRYVFQEVDYGGQ